MKYGEEEYLEEVLEYVKSTYREHYALRHDMQCFDAIVAAGKGLGFVDGNILKYIWRDKGDPRKDTLKIIHYALLRLWLIDGAPEESEEDLRRLLKAGQDELMKANDTIYGLRAENVRLQNRLVNQEWKGER